jgi:hypothetical protein
MSVKWQSNVASGRIEMTLDPPRRNPPGKIFARFRHPEGKKIIRCTVNGKPYKNFNPQKEWVVLTSWPDKPISLVTYYD